MPLSQLAKGHEAMHSHGPCIFFLGGGSRILSILNTLSWICTGCSEKLPNIFSQMVVSWWWIPRSNPPKSHQLNKSKLLHQITLDIYFAALNSKNICFCTISCWIIYLHSPPRFRCLPMVPKGATSRRKTWRQLIVLELKFKFGRWLWGGCGVVSKYPWI